MGLAVHDPRPPLGRVYGSRGIFPTSTGRPLAQLLLALVFIAIGYFIILRPQQKRLRAQRIMVETLAVGDRVITAGGIHATITEVTEETVRVSVAPGVELTLARPAIARRLDPEDGDGEVIDNKIKSVSSELGGDETVTGTPGDQAEDNVVNDRATNDDEGPSTWGPS